MSNRVTSYERGRLATWRHPIGIDYWLFCNMAFSCKLHALSKQISKWYQNTTDIKLGFFSTQFNIHSTVYQLLGLYEHLVLSFEVRPSRHGKVSLKYSPAFVIINNLKAELVNAVTSVTTLPAEILISGYMHLNCCIKTHSYWNPRLKKKYLDRKSYKQYIHVLRSEN